MSWQFDSIEKGAQALREGGGCGLQCRVIQQYWTEWIYVKPATEAKEATGPGHGPAAGQPTLMDPFPPILPSIPLLLGLLYVYRDRLSSGPQV